jgi:chromosome segregation ATPase
MSTSSMIAELRKEEKRIVELLVDLEAQSKIVDGKYTSVMGEENKVYGELLKCRDAQQYNKLQVQLNAISRRRKEVEAEKQEIERKIRGHQEELEKVKAKIEYMKPKGQLVEHKEE